MTRIRNLDNEREATRRWRAANPVRSLWSQIKGDWPDAIMPSNGRST